MAKVLVRKAEYNYPALRPLLFDLLSACDPGIIGKSSRVLIKPNLLAPAAPNTAMLTHPLIVRAVVEYVLDRGGRPQVSDSPAVGTFDRVMKVSGIAEALQGLDVDCRPLEKSVVVDVGQPFQKIEIAVDAMNADLVINLPKFKTHTQMLLTLGVKNMFGCIVGMRKPEWHYRTGVDRNRFAELLVRTYAAVNPAITVLDGILAMEGQGPGRGGSPRALDIVMASDDAVALDMVACRMLGIGEEKLPTNSAAARLGLMPAHVDIDGELPVVADMHLPELSPLVFGPKRLHGFMRRHLVQRPLCNTPLCRHCGECWRICPAKAIAPEIKGLAFDYDRCIRCYCCIEICPYGALSARDTLLGNAVRKLVKNV